MQRVDTYFPMGIQELPVFNIPIDIYDIIWCFLWPCWAEKLKDRENPVFDLYRVADIQRSIPRCLLADRVPTSGFRGDCTKHAIMYQFFPRSPYRQGNPYRPIGLTHTRFYCWSRLPTALFHILAKSGARKMRTYRAHLERKLMNHYTRDVLSWNSSYVQLFQYFPLLTASDFLLLKDAYIGENQITLYLKELSASRFLTTALP